MLLETYIIDTTKWNKEVINFLKKELWKNELEILSYYYWYFHLIEKINYYLIQDIDISLLTLKDNKEVISLLKNFNNNIINKYKNIEKTKLLFDKEKYIFFLDIE